MIEVIAVLVLIGILLAYAFFRTTSNNNLQAEVDMFKSHLRYAQYIALCGDGTYDGIHRRNWRITAGANSYAFSRVDNAGAGVPFSIPGETFDTHTFAQGVTITAPAQINYDQWGSPGGIDISITLNRGGISANIIIMRNTGFIQ